MIDEMITLMLLMGVFGIVFFRASITSDCNHLFNKEWSTVLKGVCCIVVILVHIPSAHSTRVQNAVGSFAFVAVTIFFMLSGYGLAANKDKPGYFEHFWRNRLASLFVPMLVVNILKVCTIGSLMSTISLLLSIDGFVLMMGLCYVAFYMTFKYSQFSEKTTRKIAGMLIVAISIITYCFEDIIPFTVWPVPCLGFLYGIIFAEYKDSIVSFLAKRKLFDLQMLSMLLAAGIVGGGYLKTKDILFVGDYVLRSLLAAILILLLIKVLSKIKIGNPALHILGDVSYEVYLVHGAVIHLMDRIYTNGPSGVFIVSAVAVTILAAFVIRQIDKRIISILRI